MYRLVEFVMESAHTNVLSRYVGSVIDKVLELRYISIVRYRLVIQRECYHWNMTVEVPDGSKRRHVQNDTFRKVGD
ncbi:MAG: hypothetical protein IJK42_06730 [Prevotella sp.]|nr:hypothetical protein [Prevotella sp.]